MRARTIHAFRIPGRDPSRKYWPGDVATGRDAKWGVANGVALQIDDEAPARAGKKKAAPRNKAVHAAPSNKAG